MEYRILKAIVNPIKLTLYFLSKGPPFFSVDIDAFETAEGTFEIATPSPEHQLHHFHLNQIIHIMTKSLTTTVFTVWEFYCIFMKCPL